MSVPAVQIQNVSKRFGLVVALNKVTLEIKAGKILALLGENGAGKTTLMSVLAGQVRPDGGSISIDGKNFSRLTPEQSLKAGIGMVYQDSKLVKTMTVLENLLLVPSSGFFFKKKRLIEKITALLAQYGFDLHLNTLVSELPMGERKQVEIIKLLLLDANVLVFDEFSALLTPVESEKIFRIMRALADQGKAVVFITHRLKEVATVADEVAILRQGLLETILAGEQARSVEYLAKIMIGKPVESQIDRPFIPLKQTILKVEDLEGNGLKKSSLKLRKSEIVCVFGLTGNGQKPLVEAICGMKPVVSGQITILGQSNEVFFASDDCNKLLSYIPEDRFGIAAGKNMDILDNFLLTTQRSFTAGIWLQREKAKDIVWQLLKDFDIQAPNLEAMAGELSGGNLQKLLFARAFFSKPRLMVIEQPTQGLDVAARKEIWQLLLKAREQAGILIITSDITEAATLADQIVVMAGGSIVDQFSSDNVEKMSAISEQIGMYQM